MATESFTNVPIGGTFHREEINRETMFQVKIMYWLEGSLPLFSPVFNTRNEAQEWLEYNKSSMQRSAEIIQY